MNQNQTTSIVKAPAATAIAKWNANPEQIQLLKNTIAKGTTDDEFSLFLQVAMQMELNPFLRQIHAVRRWDPDQERMVMQIQTGIDGYRLMAERSGVYAGQEGPWWCGEDGQWVDVWLAKVAPAASKVIVHRTDKPRPFIAIALWAEYAQTKKDGTLTAMWRKRGPGQLAKCAEALAFRRAFPIEIGGGAHVDVEMDYFDAEVVEEPKFSAPPTPGVPFAASTLVAADGGVVEKGKLVAVAPAQPEPARRGRKPAEPAPADRAAANLDAAVKAVEAKERPTPAASASTPSLQPSESTSTAATGSSPVAAPVDSSPTTDRWGQPIPGPTSGGTSGGASGSEASADSSSLDTPSAASTPPPEDFGAGPIPTDIETIDPAVVKILEFESWLQTCQSQREMAAGFPKWNAWAREMSDKHKDERFRTTGELAIRMKDSWSRRKAQVPA